MDRVSTLTDEEVVRRIREGEKALYEVLMRRYNQRIFRVARAILRDEAEAEDVMQQAYVNAYTHLHQFVKTRLHRARALLRQELYERAGLATGELFPLHLTRCDRVVAAVFAELELPPPRPSAAAARARCAGWESWTCPGRADEPSPSICRGFVDRVRYPGSSASACGEMREPG